tara:strand:- start:309 stop:593 length:285 start_codon:yes stop_codon:yes gene_type:complete
VHDTKMVGEENESIIPQEILFYSDFINKNNMGKPLSEKNKEFLTTIINESIQQVRSKALYSKSKKEIKKMVNDITQLREIAEKLDLKYITPKLS